MKNLTIVFLLLTSLLFASPAFAFPIKQGDTLSNSLKVHKLNQKEIGAVSLHNDEFDLLSIRVKAATIKHHTTSESPKKDSIKLRLSSNEIDLLARLVRAEAQTEPYEGKIAVACVVLNRVESKKFPDTIKKVIYGPGQFQPVQNGEINKPADKESIKAVKAALSEKRQLAPGALFFYNPAIATSRWLDSRKTTMVIGRHVFKK
ncbi:cell wall hydrolase [Bacillus sp. X1(2014)]|uniref:cell wall hydrolase n=1 Tax=Bacillus sp. X1(2014) TaxID=1565991 RepID=UPI0011A24DEA|nr:cell wall hydrolase [Bacillus sp. X1(2014)]